LIWEELLGRRMKNFKKKKETRNHPLERTLYNIETRDIQGAKVLRRVI